MQVHYNAFSRINTPLKPVGIRHAGALTRKTTKKGNGRFLFALQYGKGPMDTRKTPHTFTRCKRKAFSTTETELSAIAAPATHGARNPAAATGMPSEL